MDKYNLYKKYIHAKNGNLPLSEEDQAQLEYQKEMEVQDILKENPIEALKVLPTQDKVEGFDFEKFKPLEESSRMSVEEKPSDVVNEMKKMEGKAKEDIAFDKEEKKAAEHNYKDTEVKAQDFVPEEKKVEVEAPKSFDDEYKKTMLRYLDLMNKEPEKDEAADWTNALVNIMAMRSQATGQPVIKPTPMQTAAERRDKDLERTGKTLEVLGKLKGDKDDKIYKVERGEGNEQFIDYYNSEEDFKKGKEPFKTVKAKEFQDSMEKLAIMMGYKNEQKDYTRGKDLYDVEKLQTEEAKKMRATTEVIRGLEGLETSLKDPNLATGALPTLKNNVVQVFSSLGIVSPNTSYDDAITEIGKLSAEELNRRSGGAFTKEEIKSVEQWMPNMKMHPDAVKHRIGKIKEIMVRIQGDINTAQKNRVKSFTDATGYSPKNVNEKKPDTEVKDKPKNWKQ